MLPLRHGIIHRSFSLRTHDRGQKLKEASEQQQFLRAVEDMEQWMTDMEGQMASEDLGKDLISVNILIKKHAVCDKGAVVSESILYTCMLGVCKGKNQKKAIGLSHMYNTADLLHL